MCWESVVDIRRICCEHVAHAVDRLSGVSGIVSHSICLCDID